MALSLIILAAGIGTRYGGLKQMAPVGPSGEFLIDYAVYDAIQAGFERVVFVVRKEIEDDFKRKIGARFPSFIDVTYVFQDISNVPKKFSVPEARTKPWGTAHATLTAASSIDGPFAVINADDFYGAHAYEILATYLRETESDETHYAMVGYPLDNTLSIHGHVARGICRINENGTLKDIKELTKIERRPTGIFHRDRLLPGKNLVSLNFWGFKPSFMDHLQVEFEKFLMESCANLQNEFFLPTVVNTLVSSELATVVILNTTGSWAGITYPEEKDDIATTIRDLITKSIYPESLWTHPQ